MSGEHVWDAWLTDVYAEEKSLGGFVFTDYGKDREVIRTYGPTPGIDKTVKVVCKPCNETWMNDITSKTRLILKDAIVHGKPTVLTPSDCETLARFTFLKAVVIDALTIQRRPTFYRQSVRWAFRTNRTLPAGFQIWISQFASKKAEGEVWAVYSQAHDGMLLGSEFFTMTYHVGHVILQFVGFKWLSRGQRHRPLPSLTEHPDWNPVTAEIWPQKAAAIGWPRPTFLDASGRIRFNQRWKALRQGPLPPHRPSTNQ